MVLSAVKLAASHVASASYDQIGRGVAGTLTRGADYPEIAEFVEFGFLYHFASFKS
jgi:hypothetical protein